MHNSVVMEVCDSGKSCADEVSGIGFVVAALATNPVEEFSAQGQISDEIYYAERSGWLDYLGSTTQVKGSRAQRTVVHSLKIIHQGQDVLMTHGHLLQHGNLISNLMRERKISPLPRRNRLRNPAGRGSIHHVLSPSHQALVYDLCRIVAACIDVHAFLHDRVRACPEGLSGLISAWLDLGALGRHLTRAGQYF